MITLPRFFVALFAITLPINVTWAEDLIQIYQQALDSDPILNSEKAAFEGAQYGRRQAVARYLPNIAFSVSDTNTDENVISSSSGFISLGKTSYSTKNYSLSLSQAIYRWDYIAQLRQTKASVRQAEATLQNTQQNLVVRVAQAYFDVLAAQDSLQFAQAEKNAIARQLEQTKQRFEVGLIAITDVHESQAAFDLAVASEIAAQNSLATSRQALRELTGQLPESLLPLGEQMELLSPDPLDMEQWVNNALSHNFNIIAAEAAVEVARMGVSQQRAGHHPTVDLVANKSNTDIGGGAFGSRETEDTSISLQLNLPIFAGGGTQAGVKQAITQLTQAKEGLEQARRATHREASAAYLNVLAGISQVKALDQAVTSTSSALKATEAGYEVGTRTTVDVLNSRRELFRAQRDYARSRYDYLLASLRLKAASGMLSEQDLQQINQWLVKS